MTCKDCIHFKVCAIKGKQYGYHPVENGKINVQVTEYDKDVDECCKHFKDKSKYIELPCEVGNTVYVICWKDRITPYVREEIVEFIDIKIDSEKKWIVINNYEEQIFNKAVFFVKESAEQRLKELKENAKI